MQNGKESILKKRIVITVIMVIVIVAAVAIFVMQKRDRTPNAGQLDDHLALSTTATTTDHTIEAASSDPTEHELVEADAYLKIELVGLGLIFEPLALTETRDIELPQPNGELNVIHITENSIEMVHSNCPGQDCIKQGIVTLANRDSRALYNMIICLPNQVVLELLSPEEAAADMAAYAAGD